MSRLPQKRKLTEELLRELILTTDANSKQRRRFALACSVLADFAKLDHNLRRLVGKYSVTTVSPKNIPDDQTIATVGLKIPSLEWRYVYGLMATYGLRNCECFLLDRSKFPVVKVGKSKRNGERLVYPLYPEWVDLFKLEDDLLPKCTGKWNGDLGARVTRAFYRYEIPFNPYSLRHAWARRSLEFGMDLSIASEMMGHSVRVHSEIYHAWLSGDVFSRAYDKLIADPSRPLPPSVGLIV
ncbi:MAG: hypothetical protein ACK5PQ_02380 [Alphaproteobacteria bacterium]